MPSGTVREAETRLRAAEEFARAARSNTIAVKKLARQTTNRARVQIINAASKSGWWRGFELLAEYSAKALGTVFYVIIALIGITYSLGYYRRFEPIDILSLFDTPDFLLSAFGSPWALVIGILSPAIVLIMLTVGYLASSIQRAYVNARDQHQYALLKRFLYLPLASLVVPLIASFLWGICESEHDVEEPKFVQYTIRGNSKPPNTGFPNQERTILLGTTSNFHIFYECGEERDGNDAAKSADTPNNGAANVDRRQATCPKGGGVFVVPTDNVASVVVRPSPSKSTGGSGSNGKCCPLDEKISAELNQIRSTLEVLNGHLAGMKADVTINAPGVAEAIRHLAKRSMATSAVDMPELVSSLSDIESTLTGIKTAINNLPGAPVFDDQSLPAASRALANINQAIVDLNKTVGSLARSSRPCSERLRLIDVVGPFPEGRHEPRDDSAQALMTDARRTLDGLFEHRTPQYLMLVGHVDFTRPKQEWIESYGPDRLALARAKWVLDTLESLAKDPDFDHAFDPGLFVHALLLSAGSMRSASDAQTKGGEESRVVEVWGCGTPI